MTTGFKSGAVDLDQIFDPYVEGVKPAATGYVAAGVDLKERYAPLSYGAQAAATGFKIASGADVNTLWAAKGTASYSQATIIPFGNLYSITKTYSHNVSAEASLTIRANGTWTIALSSSPSGGLAQGTPLSGNWHAAPAAGAGNVYEVRFTAAVSGYSSDPDAIPSWTQSTDWLPLNSDRTVSASTGMIFDGSPGDAFLAFVDGSYTVEVRKVGSANVTESVFDFYCEAMSQG